MLPLLGILLIFITQNMYNYVQKFMAAYMIARNGLVNM